MAEKCFCHLIVDGVAYKVKDADARKSIAEILAKIESGEIGGGDVDKAYVDKADKMKLDKTEEAFRVYVTGAGGKQEHMTYTTTNSPGTMVMRGDNGTFKVNDPQYANNPVTKGYFENYLQKNYSNNAAFSALEKRVKDLEDKLSPKQYYIYIDDYIYNLFFVDEVELFANWSPVGSQVDDLHVFSKEDFEATTEGANGCNWRYALPAGVTEYEFVFTACEEGTCFNIGTENKYTEIYTEIYETAMPKDGIYVNGADGYCFMK